MNARPCSKCPAALSRGNKSGLCRAHYNSDPGVIARRSPAISTARRRKLADDPEFAENQRAHGKWLSENYNGNDNISPALRARVGKKLTEMRLGWCPPELRPAYKKMVKHKVCNAKEARRRILASLTPFERAMERIKNGASLEPPMPCRPDPAYSLVGCGTAWL